MSHNLLSDGGFGGLEPPFVLRGTERQIAKLQRRSLVGLARIGVVAAEQAAKVQTVACVSRRALFETALVMQTEQSLGALVPMSVSRLQAIADIATLGIAEVVSDTVRRVTQ